VIPVLAMGETPRWGQMLTLAKDATRDEWAAYHDWRRRDPAGRWIEAY
jgi:hypothetical protein